jgi:hypothetical protein
MLTQEEFMDVQAHRRQGLTITEIARELDYHPATISRWLAGGGPSRHRQAQTPPLIDKQWAGRIAELLRRSPRLLATSVFEILVAEGFEGSYPTVARHLNALRGPRFKAAPAASVPIETAPGEECQFDFADVSAWTTGWGLGEVVCFQAILCWSRWRQWWFTTSEDREHTFEGLVRFFEAAGGVPRVGHTDRMARPLAFVPGRRLYETDLRNEEVDCAVLSGPPQRSPGATVEPRTEDQDICVDHDSARERHLDILTDRQVRPPRGGSIPRQEPNARDTIHPMRTHVRYGLDCGTDDRCYL